jgi:hypothetical protein
MLIDLLRGLRRGHAVVESERADTRVHRVGRHDLLGDPEIESWRLVNGACRLRGRLAIWMKGHGREPSLPIDALL